MYDFQGGRCQSCKDPGGVVGELAPLVVDHDHVTGMVRGLLCNSCNKMLGFARDKIERLRMAIEYLGG